MKIIEIGRGDFNDIDISYDTRVSRRHCTIVQDNNNTITLIDRSRNGTVINGVPMHGEVVLRAGDSVYVGQTRIDWQQYFPAVEQRYDPTQIDFRNQVSPVHNYNEKISNDSKTPSSTNPHYLTKKPNSYLIWGILSIIFCCLPFGIVSVVYASKVDGLWTAGDEVGAERAASKARLWFWWSFGIGLALNIFILIYYIIVGSLMMLL